MIADVFPTPVADERRIDDRLTFKSGLTYAFSDGPIFTKSKVTLFTIPPIESPPKVAAERNHQLVVSLLLPVFFLFIAPSTLLYP